MPLVMKGKTKKVIAITSGHADLDFINNFDIENSALYSASKAALNVIVAKFSAQYKKDGVLVFSMSPGVVEVGHFGDRTLTLSSRLKHLDMLLMCTHSDSKTDRGVDEIREQGSSLCASLQGSSPRRRSRPDNQVALGEGQHRDGVCRCIRLAVWKQAVGVNSGVPISSIRHSYRHRCALYFHPYRLSETELCLEYFRSRYPST